MDVVKAKAFILLLAIPLLASCQISYITKSAYHQAKILNARVPIEEALQDPSLKPEEKEKIKLAAEALRFAQEKMSLKGNGNYTQFVNLKRPYVSWAVSAAEPWQLKHHLFSYPLVGKMPYKGFFSEAEAEEEKLALEQQGYDVYLRGISAYSTLGWFKDPVLSSMLRYKDHDLVNTIIHETVHTTLYIKNSADFNERMAVFVGNLGTEMFYLEKEGPDSTTLKLIQEENQSDKLFSEFISRELKELEAWYKALPEKQRTAEAKEKRLGLIQEKFQTELKPKLPPKSYQRFQETKLNNAYLMVFKTYMQDLSDFEIVYKNLGKDLKSFMAEMKKLESHKDPAEGLKAMAHAFEKNKSQ